MILVTFRHDPLELFTMDETYGRYRHRNPVLQGGTANSTVPYLSDKTQANTSAGQACFDTVGDPHNPHYLMIERNDPIVGRSYGTISNYYEVSGWYLTELPPNGRCNSFTDVQNRTNCPSIDDAAIEGMAKTNINHPNVDVVVFLVELRDLPDMIRHIGNRIMRLSKAIKNGFKDRSYNLENYAEDALALQFGWQPLLQDLGKMLDFVADTQKRVDYVKRLASDRGLRRKQTVYKLQTDVGSKEKYVSGLYYCDTKVRYNLVEEVEQWTSTHWKYVGEHSLPDNDEDTLTLARRLVWGYGHGIDIATIWNALPWSWLIDWFWNVGDFWEAHRNTIPVQCTEVCVMTHYRCYAKDFEYTSNPHGATFVLNEAALNDVKTRHVGSVTATPTLSLPFINGKQLSILSALAVTRRFGSSR